jgi:hypothetical protein
MEQTSNTKTFVPYKKLRRTKAQRPLYNTKTFNFFDLLLKRKTRIVYSMKIHPVGAELFHADRWTDEYYRANSRFSQFCKSAWKAFLFCLSDLICNSHILLFNLYRNAISMIKLPGYEADLSPFITNFKNEKMRHVSFYINTRISLWEARFNDGVFC